MLYMNYMFENAVSFNRVLCGDSWIKSKSSKTGMFIGSGGAIGNEKNCDDGDGTNVALIAGVVVVLGAAVGLTAFFTVRRRNQRAVARKDGIEMGL